MGSVLIKPVITERSMANAQNGRYTFIIATKATKKDVKNAVEKHFNVHVTAVSTTVLKGKTARIGPRRNEVMLSNIKKATVVVKKGEKIGLFELGA